MNTSTATTSPMQRAIRFAAEHDNVGARHQLHALGICDSTWNAWLKNEFLTKMYRGVVSIGVAQPTCRGRLRGAMLRGGESAFVGGFGALWLDRGIEREPRLPELVSLTRSGTMDGIHVRRTTSLPLRERRDHAGIRAISGARAIADLSPNFTPHRMVRWMRNMEYHDTFELNDVLAAEHRLARRGHGTNLRNALREFEGDSGGHDSQLEELLASLMVGARLPAFEIGQHMPNVLQENERVDFFFRTYGIVIEADGPHHLRPLQRAIDRRRDAALRAAGYRVLRFWWYEIEDSPGKVIDAIKAALSA